MVHNDLDDYNAKNVVQTLSFDTFFNHLCTCQVNTEPNHSFALSTVKI